MVHLKRKNSNSDKGTAIKKEVDKTYGWRVII
jgi:uncharacterized protein (DUF2147 family)